MRTMCNFAAISELLAARMSYLAHHLAGEPTFPARDTWRYRAKGSLAVMISGPKRGSWHDYEAGVGGDALGFIAHMQRAPMREALQWARRWLGEDCDAHEIHPTTRQTVVARAVSPTRDMARRLWGEAMPPANTPAQAYLEARGLRLEATAPLRFHPTCPRGKSESLPAMLALMTDPETAEPVGVHRTFLLADGSGKAPVGSNGEPAKMMAGNAGVIRLSSDDEVTNGLGLAEGIETALACMQHGGWRPIWAAASAGAINRFPVLPGIEALTIFADADGPGLKAARACGERWATTGKEVRLLAPPAGDWHDTLWAMAGAA